MSVANNAILLWDSTHASIPTNFSRETGLDERFIKGQGAEAPNTAGGADTHTHTVPSHSHTLVAHTHTMSTGGDYNSSYVGSSNSPAQSASQGHSHTNVTSPSASGTPSSDGTTTGSASNRPPYVTAIFIKATKNTLIPPNATIFYKGTDTPTGFTDNATYANKFPMGASTGGNAGNSGGSTSHSHTTDHTHTCNHSHSGSITGGFTGNQDLGVGDGPSKAVVSHTHSYTSNSVNETLYHTGTIDDTNIEPAYTKLRALKNTSGNWRTIQTGMIALWLGSLESIPAGWVLCDGDNDTPNMTNRYLKIAEDGDDVLATGGSNTHTPANKSHSHSASATHSHSTGGAVGQNSLTGGTNNQSNSAISTHIHNVSSVSSTTTTLNSADMSFNEANNEPLYRTVAFIMFSKKTGGAGLTQDDL